MPIVCQSSFAEGPHSVHSTARGRLAQPNQSLLSTVSRDPTVFVHIWLAILESANFAITFAPTGNLSNLSIQPASLPTFQQFCSWRHASVSIWCLEVGTALLQPNHHGFFSPQGPRIVVRCPSTDLGVFSAVLSRRENFRIDVNPCQWAAHGPLTGMHFSL